VFLLTELVLKKQKMGEECEGGILYTGPTGFTLQQADNELNPTIQTILLRTVHGKSSAQAFVDSQNAPKITLRQASAMGGSFLRVHSDSAIGVGNVLQRLIAPNTQRRSASYLLPWDCENVDPVAVEARTGEMGGGVTTGKMSGINSSLISFRMPPQISSSQKLSSSKEQGGTKFLKTYQSSSVGFIPQLSYSSSSGFLSLPEASKTVYAPGADMSLHHPQSVHSNYPGGQKRIVINNGMHEVDSGASFRPVMSCVNVSIPAPVCPVGIIPKPVYLSMQPQQTATIGELRNAHGCGFL